MLNCYLKNYYLLLGLPITEIQVYKPGLKKKSKKKQQQQQQQQQKTTPHAQTTCTMIFSA